MCHSSNRSVAMVQGASPAVPHSSVGAGTLPAWYGRGLCSRASRSSAATHASWVFPSASSLHRLRRLIHALPARATAWAVPAPAHAAGAPPLPAPRFEQVVRNWRPPLTPQLGATHKPDRYRPAHRQRAAHPIASEAEEAVIVLMLCFQQRPTPGVDDPVAHIHHPQPGHRQC